MKIILINPPFEEQYSVGTSKSIKYVLNIIPPLGLAYLAAVLERNGSKVKIIDCTIEPSFNAAIQTIIREKPDIIGITSTTPSHESAIRITKKIKDCLSQTVIIIGGSHVTAMPCEAMKPGYFDIGVLGEGEDTFLELVQHIQKNGISNLGAIKSIIFKEGEKFTITPGRDFINNLDKIPYPARHLLPSLSKYRPTPASYKKLPLGVIMSSRGCPHKCTFCDRSVFGNIFRQRSAENVLGEVEELINKYGAKEIRFFDDCFTLDKERTLKICEGLKRRKINAPWTCLTSVECVTKDLLKEMKSVGCWQVLYGLESADPRMLKLLRKGNTIEQNMQAVRWAKEAGLSVRADFIVGTPGETLESLKKTLRFAINMDLDYAHFNKFVPFPGTELYKSLTSAGYNFDFSGGCSILDHAALLYVPEGLTKEKYREFLDIAYKKFYLRPRYIVKRLLSIRTKEEISGQLKGFFAIANL